jgi:(E)-4-hydroxy-3-methylbut-2-enyl-diphosphate synthase
MTITDTRDVRATVDQIHRLEEAGCEIVRVAVPDDEAADALPAIRRQITIPLVSDIHFNYRLALKAVAAGVDKLRINPGNIGNRKRVEEVVKAAKERGIPIRIGVNAGSLEKELIERYGYPTPEAMVESGLKHVAILEDLDFHDIIISLKSSDPPMAIEAYRMMSERVDYPLHLGITEAGTAYAGTIKSAVGIGALLAQGIGDTIRVSLSADPVEEVRAGFEILKALHLRTKGPVMIACPSCGRAEVDLIALANEVEERLKGITQSVSVAVMGCAVNGPGEAREADFGIAGGRGEGLIYKNGKILRKVKEDRLVDALMEEIEKETEERG